ncbi:MAG: hypothetical protein R8M46_07285 [Ghiorsea sp.]
MKEPEKRQTFELELDVDDSGLRNNLSHIPEMGNMGALTDTILLLFNNIDERLKLYLTTTSKEEKAELQQEMSKFLDRINSNHLIPLHFRIKVLRSFGAEVAFLNATLTSAILQAYQVGILLLLEDAEGDEEHSLALGLMCGEAIQLATHVSKLYLQEYRELGLRITNQVHALARNGMGSLAKCKDSAKKKEYLNNVREGLAWFELMRVSDFFSLKPDEQVTAYNYIEKCIDQIEVLYVPKQKVVEHIEGHTYLVSYVGERNQSRPERVNRLEQTHKHDRIVIDISVLLPILKTELRQVQEHLASEDQQKNILRIEDELLTTLSSTKHMLVCMHKLNRKHERKRERHNFSIEADFSAAMKLPNKASFVLTPGMRSQGGHESQMSLWTSNENSDVGLGAETADHIQMLKVSSLVRIVWTKEEKAFSYWARVMWMRQLEFGLGRTRVGLLYLPGKPSPIKVGSAGQESHDALAIRLKQKNKMVVWMQPAQHHLGKSMLFDVAGKTYVGKIRQLIRHGSNYSSYMVEIMHLL